MSIKQELAIIAKIIKENLLLIKFVTHRISEIHHCHNKDVKKLTLIQSKVKL